MELNDAIGLNGDAAHGTLIPCTGATHLFARDDAGIWTQKTYIKAPNTGQGELFGNVLALSDYGQTPGGRRGTGGQQCDWHLRYR